VLQADSGPGGNSHSRAESEFHPTTHKGRVLGGTDHPIRTNVAAASGGGRAETFSGRTPNHPKATQNSGDSPDGGPIPDAAAVASPLERLHFLEYRRPSPPRWLLKRALEQETVTLLSGAKSAMKSYFGQGLMAAIMLGHTEYLGLPLDPRSGHVLAVDAENVGDTVIARMGALGVEESVWRERFHYATPDDRGNVATVGQASWDEALRAAVERWQPALLVVDGTVSSTIAGDTSDVEAIKKVYASLRRIIHGYPTAAMMYHHERKRSQEFGRGAADQAAIGSVYWLNLADAGLALEYRDQETTYNDDGSYRLVTTSELQVTKNPRMGAPLQPTTFAVDSQLNADDLVASSVVRLATDPKVLALVRALIELYEEGGQKRVESGALAKAASYKDSDDSEYGRVRRRASAAKLIEGKRTYEPTDAGREYARGADLS
jgi:hypothetical protein